MLKRIKSYLFPELEELKKLVKAWQELTITHRADVHDCIEDIKELRQILENVSAELGKIKDIDTAVPALITNLQERVSGLEEKYQSHRELKPIPNGHTTFRAMRQSLERGAYAKSRNSA